MEHNPVAKSLATRATNVSTLRPDAATLKYLEKKRGDCRRVAGGGDCDRQVALECCAAMGWVLASLTYLSEHGEVIACGHHVCVLGDGTIVDPTRDQFGEGTAIRVVRPVSEDYRRYRSEYREGHRPGENRLADASALFTRSKWEGIDDVEANAKLVAERGDDWWVGPDRREALRTFLEEVVSMRPGALDADGRLVVSWLESSANRPRPSAEDRLAALDDVEATARPAR